MASSPEELEEISLSSSGPSLNSSTSSLPQHLASSEKPRHHHHHHHRTEPLAELAPREFPCRIVEWTSPDDPENPFNWPLRRKWSVTILACYMTFVVQINGTAMTSAWEAINRQFGINEAVFPHSYWPVLSWSLGGAVAPMVALPLMERFGVRWSYLSVYIALIIFLIPQALAPNFATLVIVRTFTGACTGICANITSGIISDMWRSGRNKSFSTSLWIWCLLAGLSFGPISGSGTLKLLNWRWIFWTEAINYALLIPLLIRGLPEVRHEVILIARAKKLRRDTGAKVYAAAEDVNISLSYVLHETILRPARMVATEPVVLFFALWSAFCIGTAFMFTQSIVQVYGSLYNWSYFETGMVQSAVVVGEAIGLVCTVFQDELYFRSATKNRVTPGQPIPEARLYISILGSFVGLTGGFFLYAWTSYSHFHWMVPSVGLGLAGFGLMTVTTAITGYLLDAYAKYAASAMACCALLENTMAAFLPLATARMYTDLGFNWAGSLLGFVALGLSMIPLVMLKWGPEIRMRSRFMLKAKYESEEVAATGRRGSVQRVAPV